MRILKLALSSSGYLGCNLFINNISLTNYVHQLVAMAFLNHKPDGLNLVVDHINNIRTDNRLENLQLVSHRHNSTKDRKGTSKYPGVSWRSDTKKWRAAIRIGRQQIHLGMFTDENDAALAYQKALTEYNTKLNLNPNLI